MSAAQTRVYRNAVLESEGFPVADISEYLAEPDTVVWVDFRLACTFASQSALWAINLVTEMAGAVAILRSSPLERRERDARAAAKHVAMSPAAYITGGKLRLGCDLSNASF